MQSIISFVGFTSFIYELEGFIKVKFVSKKSRVFWAIKHQERTMCTLQLELQEINRNLT